jgi:hypothetical protein
MAIRENEEMIEVELLIGTREGEAGKKAKVTQERFRQLQTGGAARPATKRDAKAVGAPPESAASSRD